MSKLLDQVINDLKAREKKGLETYGTTMDRTDLTASEWDQHLYEELLDAVLYLKKGKEMDENLVMRSITSAAVEHFGHNNQIIKAIEEMSELIKELSKEIIRKGDEDNIREEIADVQIMIDQMVYLFDVQEKIAEIRKAKLNRLNNLIIDHDNS